MGLSPERNSDIENQDKNPWLEEGTTISLLSTFQIALYMCLYAYITIVSPNWP